MFVSIVLLSLFLNSATGGWVTSSLQLPNPVAYDWATQAGTRIVFGAYNSGYADIYDSTSGTWSTYNLQTINLYEVTSLGTSVFFSGDNQVVVADIISGAQTRTTSVYQARSTTLVGTNFMVAGGATGQSATNRVDIYGTTTNTWTTSSLSTPRIYISAVTVGNLALFYGGLPMDSVSAQVSTVIDIYNVVTSTWSTATAPTSRLLPVTASIGTTAYFAFGRTSVASPLIYSIDAFDTTSQQWSTINFPFPGTLDINARIYANTIGSQLIFTVARESFNYYIYDTHTLAWTSGTVATSQWALQQSAVFKFNNQILVAGGTENKIYSYTSDNRCDYDSDCGNNAVCISAYGGSGCSCLSGFGGDNCVATPAAECIYSPVQSNATNFDPSISIDMNDNILSFMVSANLEQPPSQIPDKRFPLDSSPVALGTKITFGNVCDYPASLVGLSWTHGSATSDDCQDKYNMSIPWAQAVSKCGFSAPPNTHTFSKTVTISRTYHLPDLGDGIPILRTESVSKRLSVVFPVSVDVTVSQINVTGPEAVSTSAIVSSSYDIASDKWNIQIKVYTKRPYKLSAPSFSSIDPSLSSRYVSDSMTIIDNTACNSNSLPCTQTIAFKLSGCQSFSGDLAISTTPICNAGVSLQTCPAISGAIGIGLDISASDSCAVVNNIQFSVSSLYSYSSSSLAIPQSQFAASDIAYFGADIESTNASISGLTVRSVCLLYEGECTNVVFTALPNAAGKSPVFSVNLAQTREFTQDTGIQPFAVKATVDVTWTNGKRDLNIARVNMDSYISVTPDIPQDESYASSGAIVTASILLVTALLLLL